MANIDAAFGFRPIRRLDGAAWTGGHTTKKMLAAQALPLNRGDVVQHHTTNFVVPLAAGVTAHTALGVFVGCHYLSTALGYPIWSNYWPGAGAGGDVEVFIIDDPLVVFEAQVASPGGPMTLADVNMNADVVVAASTTGFSKWGVNATAATTATFPFRIVALGTPAPNVGNGYDHTSAFNIVEVAWNDQIHRQFLGVA